MTTTGGEFTLKLLGTSKQAQLFHAPDLLRKQLKSIRQKRLAKKAELVQDGKEIPSGFDMPSFADVKQSHNFALAHNFKPSNPIGRDYLKNGTIKGQKKLGNTVTFQLDVKTSQFISDAVLHLRLENLTPTDATHRVRYYDYPGERIIKNMQCRFNGAKLDEVTAENYVDYRNYDLPVHKEMGYKRMMGQDVPLDSYGYRDFYGVANPQAQPTIGFTYYNGAQTYKSSHDVLELWIPTLFFFGNQKTPLYTKGFDNASVEIVVEFAPATDLVECLDPTGPSTNTNFNEPKITLCEMYIGHLYLTQAMWEIYASKMTFQLIRVHRNQRIEAIDETDGDLHLNQIKWPVERMVFKFRPHVNRNNPDKWYKGALVSTSFEPFAAITGPNPGGPFAISSGFANVLTDSVTVDAIGLLTQTVKYYDENTPDGMYSSYLSWKWGAYTRTPDDPGSYMINFNNNDNRDYSYNEDENGYLDTSRTREMYLRYRSSYISSTQKVEFVMQATCLNFLMGPQQGGNSILRYIA